MSESSYLDIYVDDRFANNRPLMTYDKAGKPITKKENGETLDKKS